MIGLQPAPIRDLGWFASTTGLVVALVLAFLVLLAFLYVLLVPRGDRRASRTLRRGLTVVERSGGGRAPRPNQAGMTATDISQRAVDAVGRLPRPEGYDEGVQTQLDRAGWQLRAAEFITARIVGSLLGGVLAWALSGSVLIGVVGAVAVFLVGGLVLSAAVQRRQQRFMQQLPDTLQLLAGTLKAGYGVLQALDTVVKEMEDPISTEFQRALTEARLGLALEDALTSMADRVESEDFGWVVVAMNIQRQVGGNLAELLETIAATLREREQTRRQIQVLSAEGKLSAVVLVLLPPVILLYLLLVNPTYLSPLITNPLGWILIGVSLLLMAVGIFWMRNLIKIDV